jgi:hypothetical protein
MFNTTECDLRYEAHTTRVVAIERTGWWWTTAVSARSRPVWVGSLSSRFGWPPRQPIPNRWRRAPRSAAGPATSGRLGRL